MSSTEGLIESHKFWSVIRSFAIPVALCAITIITGTIGYFIYLPSLAAYSNASTLQLLTEGVFRSVSFLVLGLGNITADTSEAIILLNTSRAAGFLFFSYTTLSGIGLLFKRQLRPIRIKTWSILGQIPGLDDKDHVIICGIGEDGYALATEALQDGRNIVAIDTNQNNFTEEIKKGGGIVLHADATRIQTLVNKANLETATDVFVTTGDDQTNGAVVETIDRFCVDENMSTILDVTARINEDRLRRTIHKKTRSNNNIHLQTYNVHEATARELLVKYPIDDIETVNQRVHIWLIGWTPLTQEILHQLLQLMHYPTEVDRQITVIADDPNEIKQSIATQYPGIRPEWWDDESMSKFVQKLYPDIQIRSLPKSDMELLSDSASIYDLLENRDRLTIFADQTKDQPLHAFLSSWGAKIDEVARQFDLNAHLVYRDSANTSISPPTSVVKTSSYNSFVDGCSMASVCGEQRDRVARRFALIYHVLYDPDPSKLLSDIGSIGIESMDDFGTVMDWLSSLSSVNLERCEFAVWRDLPEYQRESNRHAADHARIKIRMAKIISANEDEINEETIRKLAESEHRRWCAEKILDGWEPLPDEKEDRWHNSKGEEDLRNQRYHPDIRPVKELREKMDGEWEKDTTQVKALIKNEEYINELALKL